jgi:hypothetical protein
VATDRGLFLQTDGTNYGTSRGIGGGGGSGGSSGGGSGFDVEDEGVPVGTGFTILDVVGSTLQAIDSGGGRVALVGTGKVVVKNNGTVVGSAAFPNLDFLSPFVVTDAGAGVAQIAGGGGGSTRIAQVVTTGSAASITFSSIPGTYTNLRIVVHGRDTSTIAANLGMRLRFNGDTTASNYTPEAFDESLFGAQNTSSNTSSTAGMMMGRMPGSLNNANAVGHVEIFIPHYAGTSFYKIPSSIYSSYASNNGAPIVSGNDAAVWKNTAAITNIVITAAGVAFVNGTTATLYGED